jgi:putative transposase
LLAVGTNGEGHRQVLGVELPQRQSATSLREFFARLRERGLHGLEFAVSNKPAGGLMRALVEILPGAALQRCYVHFLRKALDHLPRRADDCPQEPRWLCDRRDPARTRRDWVA